MTECNVENRTIFCDDNLDVLRGINSECIDLIYLDPPFNKNKRFTAPIGTSAEGAEFSDIFRKEDVKEEWLISIEQDYPELYHYLNGIKGVGKPYNFAYLAYMAIRLIECHRILKSTGSLYLHCDPTMSHYLKVVMDCVFGEDNFKAEVVWGYRTQGVSLTSWPKKHDVLLYYGKSGKTTFHPQKQKLIYKKPFRHTQIDTEGNYYVEVYVRDVWDDDPETKALLSQSVERTGYPTQKPVKLLERVIKASSSKSDIVLDPFCGCATTCVAAERLERQWIGIDISIKAYELVKERLTKESVAIWKPDTNVNMRTDPPKRTDLEKDYREKKYVYVISHPSYPGEYKVGVAKNYKSRLNSYQTSDPDRQYKIEYKLHTPHFRECEAYIHRIFPNKHEWEQGDLKKIISEIKHYAPAEPHDEFIMVSARGN